MENRCQINFFRQAATLFLSKKAIVKGHFLQIKVIFQYYLEICSIKCMKSGEKIGLSTNIWNDKNGLDLVFEMFQHERSEQTIRRFYERLT